jgi:methyl-accepting chemotaxis protein
MTEQQLNEGMRELGRLQKEFAQALLMLVKTIESQETYIEAASNAFEAHTNTFDTNREMMEAQSKALRELIVAMETVVKGAAENNLAIMDNTKEVRELITKVESYFGSGKGLEYDN